MAEIQGVRRSIQADYNDGLKFFKMIKKQKRECWNKFLMDSGNRDPWELVRIAKGPFEARETIGLLQDTDGTRLDTQ